MWGSFSTISSPSLSSSTFHCVIVVIGRRSISFLALSVIYRTFLHPETKLRICLLQKWYRERTNEDENIVSKEWQNKEKEKKSRSENDDEFRHFICLQNRVCRYYYIGLLGAQCISGLGRLTTTTHSSRFHWTTYRVPSPIVNGSKILFFDEWPKVLLNCWGKNVWTPFTISHANFKFYYVRMFWRVYVWIEIIVLTVTKILFFAFISFTWPRFSAPRTHISKWTDFLSTLGQNFWIAWCSFVRFKWFTQFMCVCLCEAHRDDFVLVYRRWIEIKLWRFFFLLWFVSVF